MSTVASHQYSWSNQPYYSKMILEIPRLAEPPTLPDYRTVVFPKDTFHYMCVYSSYLCYSPSLWCVKQNVMVCEAECKNDLHPSFFPSRNPLSAFLCLCHFCLIPWKVYIHVKVHSHVCSRSWSHLVVKGQMLEKVTFLF